MPYGVLGTAECPEPLRLIQGLPASGQPLWITSEDVTPPSSLLRAHAPDQIPPADFNHFIRQVLAGCRQSLLGDGPSQHYRCNPCVGAWTHTPPCPLGAFTHFFPRDSGLTSRETRSAHETIPALQLPQGAVFRGCSHSFIFRLPRLLDPQAAPTAALLPGSRAVYTTHRPGSYLLRDVVSLRVRHGQLTRLDSHQLDCSIVGCSFPHWAFLSASRQGL